MIDSLWLLLLSIFLLFSFGNLCDINMHFALINNLYVNYLWKGEVRNPRLSKG